MLMMMMTNFPNFQDKHTRSAKRLIYEPNIAKRPSKHSADVNKYNDDVVNCKSGLLKYFGNVISNVVRVSRIYVNFHTRLDWGRTKVAPEITCGSWSLFQMKVRFLTFIFYI